MRFGYVLCLLPILSLLAACPRDDGDSQSAPTSTLSHWFAGGISGKTICLVGDSTTSHAVYFVDELSTKYTADGQPLHGVAAILNYGENGASLAAFRADLVVHGLTATIAAHADLYVISYGINDVRLGSTTEDQLVQMLIDTVNQIRSSLPNADVVLRMPNSLLSEDVSGMGFVQPNANAQAYTDILRNSYLRLENQWPNVVVLDTQDLVFGTQALPSSPLMFDQLHPSAMGQVLLARALVDVIGEQP